MSVKWFHVLHGPRKPGKKHQQWTNDGYLKVLGLTAWLYDENNFKLIGSISINPATDLEEGKELDFASTVVQIQDACEPPANSRQPLEPIASAAPQISKPNTYNLSSPYSLPIISRSAKSFFRNPVNQAGQSSVTSSDTAVEKKGITKKAPAFSPKDGLLLPQLTHLPDHENFTDVVVDPRLCAKLRDHQKKGIIFMYECIMQKRHDLGSGCILADEMGLGKTLQCISLIWTVLNQGPKNGEPIAPRVIIITPAGLVKNWVAEIKKWLEDIRLTPFVIEGGAPRNSVAEYLRICKTPRHRLGRVVITSYEQASKNAEQLKLVDPPFGLMICDEGHRLKNDKSKTYITLRDCIPTERRIILTGTPVQNNLRELHSLVNFVNPNALGSYSAFERKYERTIVISKEADATDEQREIGAFTEAQLNEIINKFMLRRTKEILNDFLPCMTEYIICCRPFDVQVNIYRELISGTLESSGIAPKANDCIFAIINQLRKVCNHPRLLKTREDDESPSSLSVLNDSLATSTRIDDKSLTSTSSKLAVLDAMLKFIRKNTSERVVVVSNYRRTLDIIEELCKRRSFSFSRIDGPVPAVKRQKMVDDFNAPSSKTFVMLLSTKAGGFGLNLIGASRLILYDIDWNPAHDSQARARIWRDGQKRNVHIYSLLTTGTIEEKIFQRQIMKQGLAGVVGDNSKSTKFTSDELKELFYLDETTSSSTHDIISPLCNCSPQDTAQECAPAKKKAKCAKNNEYDLFNDDDNNEDDESKNDNESLTMANLKSWEHFSGGDLEGCDFECIPVAQGQISFIFRNRLNEPPPSQDQ